MSGPASRTLGEDLAPRLELEINDVPIKADIMSLLRGADYEHCVNMISAGKVTLNNPGFNIFRQGPPPNVYGAGAPQVESLLSHQAFQPGGIMAFRFGYGKGPAKEIGRMIIGRHLPDYPESAMPEVTIPGMDAGKLMTGVQGAVSGEAAFNKRNAAFRVVKRGYRKDAKAGFLTLGAKRLVASRDNQGTMWMRSKTQGVLPSEIVKAIGEKYNFLIDIPDEELDGEKKGKHLPMLQPKGMSDYKLIQHLANIYGKEMWVDWRTADDDSRGDNGPDDEGWTLHWRHSQGRKASDLGAEPRAMYNFNYAKDDTGKPTNTSSLLSFQPTFAMQDVATDINVGAYDPKTKEMRHLLEATLDAGGNLTFGIGGDRLASSRASDDAQIRQGPQRRQTRPSAQAGDEAAWQAQHGRNASGPENHLLWLAHQRNTQKEQRKATKRGLFDGSKRNLLDFAKLKDPFTAQMTAGGVSFNFVMRPGELLVSGAGVDDILRILTLKVRRIAGLFRDFFLTGEGTAVGNEDIRAGQVHRLDGLDPMMCGLWEFKKVQHLFGENGYRIRFTANKIFL